MNRSLVFGMYGLLVFIWSSTWVALQLFSRSETAWETDPSAWTDALAALEREALTS